MTQLPLREILQLVVQELDGNYLTLSDEAADAILVQLDRHLENFAKSRSHSDAPTKPSATGSELPQTLSTAL